MSFQQIMRNIRKEHGYTQQNIADIFKMPRSTYKSYESGIATPSPYFLIDFADFFDITVDELLGRTTAPALFDNGRIERPEILELFDELTPEQQQNLLNYARGMAVSNTLANSQSNKKRA